MQNIDNLKHCKMNTEQVQNPGNLIFIGFMFIGIAIGLYFNVVAAGTLTGMGAGFIAKAILSNRNKTAKQNGEIKNI